MAQVARFAQSYNKTPCAPLISKLIKYRNLRNFNQLNKAEINNSLSMIKPRYIAYLIIAFLSLLMPAGVYAFDSSVYTEKSVLSEGRWVKIRIDEDGLYHIPASQLRSWGFSDPKQVVIRGYGGRRQDDILSLENYIDDLPEVQTLVSDKGIVFYGIGAGEWTAYNKDNYYFEQNDYSSAGYYFVGLRADGAEPRTIDTVDAVPAAGAPLDDTYSCRLHHEQELTQVQGEAGPLLLGEDLRFTNKRKISFPIPDAVEGDYIFYRLSLVTAASGAGTVQINCNGNTKSSKVEATSSSSYVHGTETIVTASARIQGNPASAEFEISYNGSGNVTAANINYLSINYQRMLKLPSSNYLVFNTDSQANSLACANPTELTLWDVTDPLNIKAVKGSADNGAYNWSLAKVGMRDFAAFTDVAKIPTPKVVATVSNQNLHALRDLDMVIVSPAQFREQAMRLADFHAKSPDKLSVTVVTPDEIYNEFSSGTTDIGGIRRFFKMLYDRGGLRYAILFGRTTLDNRGLTAYAPSYPTLPSWMPRGAASSLSDNTGYCSDDITAMLEDGSGSRMGSDKLSIAIGRMPVTSVREARDVVDKTIDYANKSKKTAWKHRFLFLADDEDGSIHLKQTETMLKQYDVSGGSIMLPRKVYIDAYDYVGSTYPEARKAMYRMLDEGVVWWNFVGHASPTGWTKEGMLSYSDLNSLYLRHWPFIYAATCDFLRLDSRRVSGGELMYLERYGGAIGMISAVRPVYISDNGKLTAAIGRALAEIGTDSAILTPGEIYRRAKNDIRTEDNNSQMSDDNRLRYIFVGDPALPLAMPVNNVRIDTIKGISIADTDVQPTLAALERATISGSVMSNDGTELSDFEGVLLVDIFDSERTVSTNGRGEGTVENFEDIGGRIYTGSAPVKNGHFTLEVAMPAEVAQNFRPAAMSLYAYSTTDDTEAVGLFRNFYVYGYDDSVTPDDKAPVIESMVLNHSDFRSGDAVNDTPMLIAQLRDDVGINVSTAGIGHQLTAVVDGIKTFTGLSDYYTPSADGSPSGVLNYPMSGLTPGKHTLTLQVWDTSGNAAEKTIEFAVVEGMAPKIYDVYSDANPASTTANFYLSHNQPDGNVTVTITVYNLIGRPVWSGSSSGRSDMFLSVPVSWDLTDNAGRRVGRGIYLYRATITADGKTYETASRRIAVTAR